MKKAALYVGIIAALICGTTFAAVISGTSVGSSAVYTTPVPAQYVAASYGSALANESIAAGTDSALYCAMDNLDGTTSTPECGLNAIRHKGVGPFSDADKLSVAAPSVLHQPGDFWGCVTFYASSFPAIHTIAETKSVTGGWTLRALWWTMALDFYNSVGAVTTLTFAAPTAGQMNHICFGRSGTTAYAQTNGGVVSTGAAGTAAAGGGVATIGLSYANNNPFIGQIFEMTLATGAPSAALFNASWAAATTCRNAGRCLPSTANEVMYLGGDQYTIGGSWCGDYPTCSAAKTFTRTGTVTTRERRYSWPSLTPTQNGTVPRVATSGIHRQGYGARHASLSGWSGTNNLRLGTGNDVLDFTGDFTLCFSFGPTSVTGVDPTLFENTDYTEKGYAITLAQTTGALKLLKYGVLATKSAVTTNGSNLHNTNFGCVGRSGTTLFARLNNGSVTTTTGATDLVAATSTVAIVGVSASLGRPFVGDISEVFATTTPATAEYLTFLTDAAMRCTTQGNCFPRDANTVMHCNGDEFTGGVLRCGVNTGADPWTTNGTVTLNAPSFYNSTAQRISASGAGPYSSANYFQWGTGADVLDFTGSWTVCSSFDVTTTSGQVVNGGYTAGGDGWTMTYVSGKLQCTVATVLGGAVSVDTSTNAGSDGSLNIGCCGWTRGSNIVSARLNASAIATQGGASFAPATTIPSYIGRRNAAGTELGGRVYEILALNKAPTTELLDTIHRRWLNHQSLTGQALSNTHTIDTSTYHSAGKVWRRGANMQRQESARSMRVLDGYNIVPPVPGPGVRLFVPPGRTFYGSYNNEVTGLTLSGTSTSVTGTPNGAVAPDGTMTALAVRDTAATADHLAYFDVASPACVGNESYAIVVSVYIRPVGYTCIRAGITNGSVLYSDNDSVDVLGGYTDLNPDTQYGQEYLADGWIRYWWATGYFPCGGARLFVRAKAGSIPCSYTPSWAGDTSKGFDIWGLSMEVFAPVPLSPTSAPLPKPFCAYSTTCTAETVTVPNPLRPNGSDWTNLLLQSEDLATTWTTNFTTVTTNSYLSPDGSFTMDKIVSANIAGNVYQAVARTSSTGPFVGSAYVRSDTGTSNMSVASTCGTGGTVAATNCSCGTEDGRPCTAFLSDTGSYACVAYALVGTAPVRLWATHECASAVNTGYFFVHDGIYKTDSVAGAAGMAQLETGSTPSPYCPTTTTARTCGPGGATGKTVTNSALRSEDLLTGWTAVNAGVTDAGALDKVTSTNNKGIVYQCPTVASTTVVTASADVLSNSGTSVQSLIAGCNTVAPVSCACARADGGSCTVINSGVDNCIGYSTFTDASPVRFAVAAVCSAGTTTPCIGFHDGQWGASNGVAGLFGRAQLTTNGATDYCGPTAAASRTCAPTQRWCVRVKDATPGYGRKWTMTTGTVLAAGGAYNGANSWNVQAYGTKIYLDSRGADSGVAFSMNADHTFTAGSTHTIVACANNGVGTLYYDGSFTPAGTGSVATFSNWPTSAFMGSVAAGVYPWNGTIGSLEFNTTGDPRDFVWDRRTP